MKCYTWEFDSDHRSMLKVEMLPFVNIAKVATKNDLNDTVVPYLPANPGIIVYLTMLLLFTHLNIYVEGTQAQAE
jgi:hypothetical protein